MKTVEKIYWSDALMNGWTAIGPGRTWWFDTSEVYPAQYSLDRQGVPICWDDDVFKVEETRECTGDDTCTIILAADKDKKAVVMIHKDQPNVLIKGSVVREVTWADYNREGLWAVKKHCSGYKLEAVIINPKMKTLQKYKILKSLVQEIVRDTGKGDVNEPAAKKDAKNQGVPAAA